MTEAKFLKLGVIACLVAAAGTAANARGPVCGALETAADGYCDVYCEALDCDGAPRGTVETCVAVFDAYKKDAGTAPPCEADLVCPCVDAFPAFAQLTNAPNENAACASAGGRGRAGKVGADVEALTCSVTHGKGRTETLSVTYEEAQACVRRIEDAAAARQNCS